MGCHFLLQCVKVKTESEVAQLCLTLCYPMTTAYQAPLSMGFSRQEYWSGLPVPSRDNIKCTNIHLIDIPEGEDRQKGAKKIFEEIMAETSLTWERK